jgi:hypothetical protein
MQFVVTVNSTDPVIDQIFTYCDQHDIVMYSGRFIVVDDQYWYWRIEADESAGLSWLLLKYGRYIVAV